MARLRRIKEAHWIRLVKRGRQRMKAKCATTRNTEWQYGEVEGAEEEEEEEEKGEKPV